MSDNMSRFLGDEPEDEGAPTPAAVEQPQRDFEPVPEPEPEPEAPAEPEPAPAEPVEPPAPVGGRMVPLSALEAERAKRQDFERRLAELEKPKPAMPAAPAAQQPAPQWINPAEDPVGYHARIQELMLNQTLNQSQMAAQRVHGYDKVAAAATEFKAAMEQNPALQAQLYQQLDPYDWMMKEVEAMRLRKEIGEDPAAYRARIRAEIEAEMAAQAPAQTDTLSALPLPRTSPAAGLQPSLARARSVAGRVTVDESDQPLGDILRGR